MCGVEGEADIVKGRGDETAGRNGAACVLVHESFFEKKGGEEGTNGGDKKAEFGAFGGASAFMIDWEGLVNDQNGGNSRGSVGWAITMVVDELFNIFHDFTIAAAGLNGHVRERGIAGYGSGLGVKNKGNREEAFDEFDKGITTVGLREIQTGQHDPM